MKVLAWPYRDKKTSLPGLEEELMMSAQEWGWKWSFPPPHFFFDYRTVAHYVLRVAPSPLPTCKPHKHPVLINKFLSITLCLAEFFLHWNIKNQSSSAQPHPWDSTNQFQFYNCWKKLETSSMYSCWKHWPPACPQLHPSDHWCNITQTRFSPTMYKSSKQKKIPLPATTI